MHTLSSLPLEIRYIVWEYTWPPPMVIEPMFHRHDNEEDDSSDDEEEPDDSQRVIILHPVGSLSTFSENSLHIRGLTT